uniref:Uncharacterized protein n=1 Tax=Glossina pallidipes TaxID=7398 RepID=A0A1B0A5N8_GLOPL
MDEMFSAKALLGDEELANLWFHMENLKRHLKKLPRHHLLNRLAKLAEIGEKKETVNEIMKFNCGPFPMKTTLTPYSEKGEKEIENVVSFYGHFELKVGETR